MNRPRILLEGHTYYLSTRGVAWWSAYLAFVLGIIARLDGLVLAAFVSVILITPAPSVGYESWSRNNARRTWRRG